MALSATALDASVVLLTLVTSIVTFGIGLWLRSLRSGGRYLPFYRYWLAFVVPFAAFFALGLLLLLRLLYNRRRKAGGDGDGPSRVSLALATLLLLVLVGVAAVAIWLLFHFGSETRFRATALARWRDDVTGGDIAGVCRVEERFYCHGFTASECECKYPQLQEGEEGPRVGLVDTAAPVPDCSPHRNCTTCQAIGLGRGCFDSLRDGVRRSLIPIAVVDAVAAGVLALVLVLTTCG